MSISLLDTCSTFSIPYENHPSSQDPRILLDVVNPFVRGNDLILEKWVGFRCVYLHILCVDQGLEVIARRK